MLIVADQPPLRIGGERRLARSGKSEEERRVSLLAQVGRAVHGEDIAGGQEKVHHAEDRLFHLPGIFCAPDQDDAAGEVRDDESARVGAIALRHSLEFGSGNHGKFRLMPGQFLRGHRTNNCFTNSACQAYSAMIWTGSR